MNTTTDILAAQMRVLDEEPWLTMFAIADRHEEAGDSHLAAGWRWLARRRKRPGRSSFWHWSKMLYSQRIGVNMTGSWQLPSAAFSWLGACRQRIGRNFYEFDTCSEAYQRAAEAMASLSQQGIDIENLERESLRDAPGLPESRG